MSGLTLYEISDELEALVDTLEMCDTEEKRDACEADIQQARTALVHKVDNYSHYFAHLESLQTQAANEIERLKDRQHQLLRRQQRLEQYVIHVMQEMNVKKLDGDTSQLSLRQNQAAVEITDLAQVPGEFKTVEQKVVVTADKRAIKKAIESGREIPGADMRFGTISLVRK